MLNPGRPYFYLLLCIVILYVRPQEYVPALLEAPIVPLTMVGAALFWLIAQPRSFEASQHGLLLWLFFAMVWSVLMVGYFMGAWLAFTSFLPTLLLFYMTATSVDSIKRLREMGIVLVAVSVVIAYHGMGQVADEQGVGWTGVQTIEGRITYLGFLNDPNDLAMAFLMSLPFAFYLARLSSSFLMRLAWYAAAGAILYGIYLCNSRGSMLGIAAMLFVYGVRRYGLLRSVVVVPLLLIPLILVAPSRISEMSADEDSAAGRWDAWYEGFEMFRSYPLFGVGKGMFVEHTRLTAHNSFVLAIAELGLFGYFFWLSILAVSALMLYRILRSPEPPAPVPAPAGVGRSRYEVRLPPAPPTEPPPKWADLQLAALTLACSLAGSLVAAFFLSRSYVLILYLLIALIVAVYQLVRRHWPGFAPVRATDMLGRLVVLELASIVFLFLLTRVLLSLA